MTMSEPTAARSMASSTIVAPARCASRSARERTFFALSRPTPGRREMMWRTMPPVALAAAVAKRSGAPFGSTDVRPPDTMGT